MHTDVSAFTPFSYIVSVFFHFFILFLVYSIFFHLGGPSDDLGGAWGVFQTSLEVFGGCVREIRGSKESPGYHI